MGDCSADFKCVEGVGVQIDSAPHDNAEDVIGRVRCGIVLCVCRLWIQV
jgi:hypothetical protein